MFMLKESPSQNWVTKSEGMWKSQPTHYSHYNIIKAWPILVDMSWFFQVKCSLLIHVIGVVWLPPDAWLMVYPPCLNIIHHIGWPCSNYLTQPNHPLWLLMPWVLGYLWCHWGCGLWMMGGLVSGQYLDVAQRTFSNAYSYRNVCI